MTRKESKQSRILPIPHSALEVLSTPSYRRAQSSIHDSEDDRGVVDGSYIYTQMQVLSEGESRKEKST